VIGIAWLMLSVDGADAALALWIMAAAHGLAAAVGVLGPGRPEVSARALPSVAARHWQVGRWLLATTGVEWLQGQLLTLIAGAVLGATVVGAMRATQQVIGITHLLFEGLQNVVPVGAARALAASGRRALRAYTFGAMFGTGLATGAIVFMLLAAPEAWLSLIYGERLAGWGWLLYWQGAIYLAIVPGLPLSAGLTALERTRPLFLAQMLGAVATVLLGVPVARSFGIQGLMLLTLVVLVGRQLLLGRAFWRASAQAG
jgi:O-antigen/teichoic acid export membrane protein